MDEFGPRFQTTKFWAFLFLFSVNLSSFSQETLASSSNCASQLSDLFRPLWFWKKAKLDEKLFRAEVSYFRELRSQEVRAPLKGREQKLALIAVSLEDFRGEAYHWDPAGLSEKLERISKRAQLSLRKLDHFEAERIAKALLLEEAGALRKRTVVEKVLLGSAPPDIGALVCESMISQKEFQDRILELKRLGYLKQPRFRKRVAKALGRYSEGWELARGAILNALLFVLGVPLFYPPNLHPVTWVEPGPGICRLAKENGIASGAQEFAKHNQMAHRAHFIYRGLRHIYLMSLLSLSLVFVAKHPEVIATSVNSIRFAIKVRFLDRQDYVEHERSTYHSQSVIDEQMKSWEGSLEEAPSETERRRQREFFEDQERRGVLKIFKEPAD